MRTPQLALPQWRGGLIVGGEKKGANMRIWPVIPLLALAACGSESKIEMENASVAEVAEEMREAKTASFVNPGRWEQRATLLAIEAPGMPPEAREMMGKAVGQAQVHDACLTPEQAKNPREDFFFAAEKNCRYEHFNWGDDKIDLKLNCDHPNAKQTMALVGDYQPNSYTMNMTATSAGAEPGVQMTMKMRVDAKRVGECTAEQAQAARKAAETSGGGQ